jgi:hypothetical protein
VPDAQQGEIWTVDLGMAAKVRPCLLLTDFPEDDELALITVLPHTTSLRGNRRELTIPQALLETRRISFAANPIRERRPPCSQAGRGDTAGVATSSGQTPRTVFPVSLEGDIASLFLARL